MPFEFQSPGDDTNSSSADEEEFASAPLEPQESATESFGELATRLPSLQGTGPEELPEFKPAVMNSSLLEFYCNQRAAELLNQGLSEPRYTRTSPEAMAFGKTIFENQSKYLSSQGWIEPDLDREELAHLRDCHRTGLDELGFKLMKQGTKTGSPRALSPLPGFSRVKTYPPQPSGPTQRQLLPFGERDYQPMASIAQSMSLMRLVTPNPTLGNPSASFPLAPSYLQSPLFVTRYANEFDEVKMVGRGGYGKVYHVKNHVDNQHYAIKKIPLTAKRLRKIHEGDIHEFETILKEIRTQASLEHSNVVRYYGAWFERTNSEDDGISAAPGRVSSPPRALLGNTPARESEDTSFGDVLEEAKEVETDPDEGDCGILFGVSTENEGKTHQAPTIVTNATDGKPPTMSKKSFVLSTGGGEDNEVIEAVPRKLGLPSLGQTSTAGLVDDDIFTDGFGEGETRLAREEKGVQGPTVVLHIQMSLHPLSLAVFLGPAPADTTISSPRHCYHLEPSIRLMLAILGGVEYLHTQGVVHRDLKPGNIFLAESIHRVSKRCGININRCPECRATGDLPPFYITPRIGDFGLVAEISGTTPVPSDAAHITPISPGRAVGTEFYRPPTRTVSIDEKLDVYALGVVMFELVWKFDTRMERAFVLPELCKGNLPMDFASKVGAGGKALESCIKGMVEEDAEKRYGCKKARECLERILMEDL